ncbi:YVTN repeat-like/Quino protein amine dehydrogenase [Durotheca rogersii]|uniref:YVTN repeat-like/Quino protein amine dehydrogenase n=1 Tax=Durotheca rogersii TaxID=419775 RepID=UPI00221EAC10|nr:YVTN repeat-like/Quino protein amine dehydrogenase [Durotheca rogersii]KAI5866526.1 YVTN repeat-like/Quino protein amine dehydrogenase [Durotheca rogersii]
MATLVPPPSKRQRREALERSQIQQDVTSQAIDAGSFKARFVDTDGNQLAETIEVPLADATEKNVSLLLNTLLGREREDFTPYRFRIHVPNSDVIIDNYPTPSEFLAVLRKHGIENPFETTITLAAEPQAVFKVQAVTRMSNRIPGHGEAILAAQFSPKTSSLLATGSGDNTARIWNTDSGTPKYTLKGHSGWVLAVTWSPDGQSLATGSMDKTVRIWDEAGQAVGKPLNGHSKWITSIAWQPFHLWRDDTPRLASASKDATIRVWIVNTGRIEHVLSGHKGSVSCVRWGGTDLVYTASQDKTVKVWNAADGTLKHTLASHAHWVNHLALSTDFVLRTAFYDHTRDVPASTEEKRAKARERFEKAATQQGKVVERIISASDDFTMYLWDPSQGTKPLARLLGHQKQVNHVSFSPDGNLIASAGWDNHIKIWARDGKFLTTLRAHVAPVYQCAFSSDSRLLCSGSRDTTLKVWDMRTFKLSVDLPGHEDEVYALDWSLDGRLVGSGGKDKAVRLWRN